MPETYVASILNQSWAVFGLVRDATGNFSFGLLPIACGPVMSAIVVLLLGHDRRLEHIPARSAAE